MLVYINYNYNRWKNSSVPYGPAGDINNHQQLEFTTSNHHQPLHNQTQPPSSIHHRSIKSNHHHQFLNPKWTYPFPTPFSPLVTAPCVPGSISFCLVLPTIRSISIFRDGPPSFLSKPSNFALQLVPTSPE